MFAVSFAVEGADVVAVSAEPSAGEDLLLRGIVRAPGQYTRLHLELANLVPHQKVKIVTAEVKRNKDTSTWEEVLAGPTKELLVVPPPVVVRPTP